MKIKEIFFGDILTYALLGMSCIILAMLFYFQPKISDDWYVIWNYPTANGVVDYWINFYKGWTGRASLILLSSLVLTSPIFDVIYRLFIVLELFMLLGLSWFCALGALHFNYREGMLQALILFAMLLWLALPVRAETVAWTIGNFAYLLSAIMGLAFIAHSKFFISVRYFQIFDGLTLKVFISVLCFFIGFFAGSSHEQVIAACIVFIVVNLYKHYRFEKLNTISINYWILFIGFCLGTIFLVAAPGNYSRLSAVEAPGFYELAKRMVLFIASAFFEIGTGDLGKPIWMGILLLFALFYDNQLDKPENVREAKIWLCLSAATLLTLIPATNQISPRTTFFAVIFLYIAVATFLFKDKVFPKRAIVSLALLVTSSLVLVEATVGLIANISVASEFNHRWALINANQSKQMTVPFIATIPSNLTYIQTPEQDREFLKALSAHVGFIVEHDNREGAPLPASLKPLKAIKFQ
jgi:hypothetical protein